MPGSGHGEHEFAHLAMIGIGTNSKLCKDNVTNMKDPRIRTRGIDKFTMPALVFIKEEFGNIVGCRLQHGLVLGNGFNRMKE